MLGFFWLVGFLGAFFFLGAQLANSYFLFHDESFYKSTDKITEAMKNRTKFSSVTLKNIVIRTTLEVRKAKVNLRQRINCDKKDNENYLNVHKTFKHLL